MLIRKLLCFTLAAASTGFAAGPLAEIYDDQVKTVENDVVRLAEAMPADKYNFAPTSPGTFTGVRTFGMQVKHIATIIYMVSASALGEKAPVDIGTTDNGPDSLKTKAEILAYLKGAIAFGHKAANNLTEKNQLDDVKSPFGSGTMKRVATVGVIGWHSFDHYGQMVVYARMNGVVPGTPPAAPAPKK